MSAEHARGLFLKPPEKLPSTGVTKISFKVFINQLVAYLEQDPVNDFFLGEECYATWNPRQGGKRILILSKKDPEKKRLDKELAAQKITEEFHTEEERKLLILRNSQLGKCIQLVAVHCYYTEQDDIDQCSTSLSWIIEYLEKHYNIQSKGVHFLDIASLTYKKGTPHQTFFKQFRSMFMDNLRKRGDKLEYKNDEVLQVDEKMTPTLESTIVLWALERIDPRLPTKVQKMYGHQMTGNKCLMSLQPTIFQNIPLMLQELDQAANANVMVEGESVLGAGWAGGTLKRGGGTKPGSRGRGRGNTGERRFRNRKPSDKFCRICYHAGSSQYQTHTIADCYLLTSADKSNLRSVLGAVDVGSQEGQDDVKLEPFDAPGWDVEAAKVEDDDQDTL